MRCLRDNVVPGGIDTNLAEHMVEYFCDGREISALDGCGGHAMPYHYHERMQCLYDADAATGHSTRIGTAGDGNGIYGRFIDGGVEPDDLDACGGRFGVTPDSDGEVVYYYPVTSAAPFVLGCYGPVNSVQECRDLYPRTCGRNAEVVEVTTIYGTGLYTLDCPCFDENESNVIGQGRPGFLAPSPSDPATTTSSPTSGPITSTPAPTPSTPEATLAPTEVPTPNPTSTEIAASTPASTSEPTPTPPTLDPTSNPTPAPTSVPTPVPLPPTLAPVATRPVILRSLDLVTASSDSDLLVSDMQMGAEISLSSVGTRLSMIANVVATADVGTVQFHYDGSIWTERLAVYAMAGNYNNFIHPVEYLSTPGNKLLTVIVFDKQGEMMDSATISFTIVA